MVQRRRQAVELLRTLAPLHPMVVGESCSRLLELCVQQPSLVDAAMHVRLVQLLVHSVEHGAGTLLDQAVDAVGGDEFLMSWRCAGCVCVVILCMVHVWQAGM